MAANTSDMSKQPVTLVLDGLLALFENVAVLLSDSLERGVQLELASAERSQRRVRQAQT